MKNRTLLQTVLILVSVFVLLPFISKAATFGSSDWSVTYYPCTGEIEVDLLYYDKGGTAVGNTRMKQLLLAYTNTSGGQTQFFYWKHDDYSLSPIHGTDVTDGETFNYGFNAGLAKGSWSWYYQAGSSNEKVRMKVKFKDLPDALIGGEVTIHMDGEWDVLCCFSGSDDVDIDNWTKTASTTSISAPTAPAATTDVHCNKVRITWTNPTNISSACGSSANWKVYVYRNGSYIGNGGKLGYFDDTGAVKGTTYQYKVQALFEPQAYIDNTSAFSSEVSGRRIGPLPPPTNVVASNDRCDGQILVAWDWSAASPDNFLIQRSTSSGSGFTTLPSATALSGNVRQHLDTPPSSNVNYYYRMKSKNSCGDWSTTYSAVTNPAGMSPGTPAAPTGVTATANVNKIDISWNDNSSNETHFLIERSVAGGGSPLVIEVPAGTTTYEDSDVDICESFTYRLKAKTACFPDGVGTAEATAIIEPDLSTTFPPNSLQASKGYYPDKVELSWINSNDNLVNSVKIYRKPLASLDTFALLFTLNSGSGIYNDIFADAGVLYQYKIQAEGLCENIVIYSNTSEAIGFRSKAGTVTGQVNYSGGIAVNGAKISAESTSGINGMSLSFNGSSSMRIDDAATLDASGGLLMEAWIRPTSYASDFTIVEKVGSYSLEYLSSSNQYRFKVFKTAVISDSLFIPESAIMLNNFGHIAAQVFMDSLEIFVNGNKIASKSVAGINVHDNASDVNIGSGFQGIIDEFRIWNTGKTADIQLQDYSRVMVGGESGLRVYLRMNEGLGSFAYDASKVSNIFNKNHAAFIGTPTWSMTIPTVSQLGVASYTDSLGNYVMVVPYNGSGEVFVLTPSFLVHEFDPATTALFLGDGSLVHNNVNFLDNSSFRVTGALNFKNTTCGVKDAFIKVDGEILVVDGSAARTDAAGLFDVNVPIGDHFIEVTMPGHVYSVGRFPPTGKFNFQEDQAGINFTDSTLVNVVGRVVGGLREASKIPGLGRSKNNIGVARVILKSQQLNGCSTDTVFTDAVTGEYSVMLPPLKYVPTVGIPSNPVINFGVLDIVDLSGTPFLKTRFDTLFDIDGTTVVSIDSVRFHKQLDYIYRVDPQIAVYGKDGVSPFIGDSTYTHINAPGDTLRQNLRSSPFAWPVFHQQADDFLYRALIHVFESYKNLTTGVVDSVPTTDGMLKFNNELSHLPIVEVALKDVNTLDTLKSLIYSFKPGYPNYIENVSIPEYSYTRKFEINLITSTGTAIPWLPVAPQDMPTGGDLIFRGYLLGKQSNGTQFITEGPQVPEYVLRDPPGSGSSASREVGTTKTEKTAWNWNLGAAAHTSDGVYLGAKFSIGLGVSTATDIENNLTAGFKAEIGGGNSGEQSITTTNTQSWSTFDGTDIAPGANSDLYVGKSKNVQFGISEELAIIPQTLCGQVECIGATATNPSGSLKFAKKYGLSVVPGGFQTTFIFNEYDIKSFIIPNLLHLRDVMLQSNPKFTSHLNIGTPNYGKNNDDPDFGMSASTATPTTGEYADLTGPSYTYAAVGLEDSISGDSVRLLNHQVRLWEEAIKLNEWEKVNIGNSTVIDSLRQVELDALDVEYAVVKGAYIALIVANGLGGVVVAYGLIAAPVPGTSFAGYATFAVTTGTGIALAELFEEYETYLAKMDNINSKFDALGTAANYTITGGNTFSSSVTHQTASSYTQSLEYSTSADFVIKVEGKVNNNGIGIEKGLAMEFKSGRDWTTENDSTETVGFTLNDPDIGDIFSVDVFPSLLGWGPIFKTKAGGATSCPHEDAVVTTYYQPGTEIAGRTLQIEKPTISVSPSILTNVPITDAAVFNLTLANESEAGYAVEYEFGIVSTSNPFGAIIKVDGVSPNQSIPLQPGTSVNKVLTIAKGPGAVYDYDDILIVIHSSCQYTAGTGFNTDIVDSVYVSAHFLPTCTDVSLATPEDQWVLNNSFDDTMPVAIIDYNINFFDLENIRFDYKPSSEPNWIGLQTFLKDTSGLNDPELVPIPEETAFTLYDWDVSSLPDGFYDVRVVTNCTLADNTSVTHSGVIDRINPHPFGNPSPADGILSPNDEISIKFNEPIDPGSINPTFNFDIRGVTNGTEVDHSTSLFFDGLDDYVEITGGTHLQNRDFTIEFSAKPNGSGVQTVFSQGTDMNERLFIGFDAAGHFIFQINDQMVASSSTFNDNEWHYFAVSYDFDGETAELFVADATHTSFVSNNGFTTIFPDYVGAGKVQVGKNTVNGTDFFTGNIHELRIWNYARSLAEFSVYKSLLLSGSELGLLYNWRMDEADGTLAEEHIRRRDATVFGPQWQIEPNGNAVSFDGMDDYLKIFTGDVNITNGMDYTLEFWFNSDQAGPATLVSNGTGDGTASDSLLSWNIDKDNAGQIHVKHYGMDFTAVNDNYFDATWHHFALVFRRTGNMSAYIDGNLQNSTQALPFQQFGGSHMYLGARGFSMGLVETVENHYDGKMDEFRFWNTSRKLSQLKRDKQHRMSADELGLKVYMPFEYYSLMTGIPILTQTFDEQIDVGHTVMNSGATLISQTPTIKLQRPVQPIAFTYSVNNDEIILTPTTSQEIIENVTLDITVQMIRDLHGNDMESPVTWIAYIDKNQVIWQDDLLSFSLLREDKLSFTSGIVNQGGAAETFKILDIPSWLKVTPSSGTIDPNSSIEVSFEVDPELSIGDYTIDLSLLTDFNYPERLTIDLKVRESEPVWDFDASDYEHSMSLIGQLKINNVISTDDEDILIAMVGQQIRGVARLEYVEELDAHLVFLDAFSNASDPEILEFRIWDASSGTIFSSVIPVDIDFSSNTLVGTALSPQIFEASSEISAHIPLSKGWNWLGFFLDPVDPMDVTEVLTSIPHMNGDQIKGQTTYADYNGNSLKFNGTLTNAPGIQPEQLYKFITFQDDTLVMKGDIIDPTTKPVTLVPGWNWIGFISIRNQSIAQALGNLTPAENDLIKGKNRFAVYDPLLGWVGSLKTLTPGAGYMYLNTDVQKVFTYPIAGMFNSLVAYEEPDTYAFSRWEVNSAEFNTNMTMISQVITDCDALRTSSNYAIGVEDGNGEMRGIAPLELFADDEVSYLTVAGLPHDVLHLKLLNTENGESIDLDQYFRYETNEHVGDLYAPFTIEISDEVCSALKTEEDVAEVGLKAFPTVFSQSFDVEFTASVDDGHARVELTDTWGKVVYASDMPLVEGYNKQSFDMSYTHLSAGIYFLELKTKGIFEAVKLIKAN